MSIVCIDTHIIIWGVKEQATPGQENMIPRAKAFIKWLEENRKIVAIPSPIITELLAPVHLEEQEGFLKIIHEKFRVYSYDEIAAVKCAQIWQLNKDKQELNEYREQHTLSREQMKYDYQIVAIAITKNAECIYSNDPHLSKFAGDLISVREMPLIATQTQLDL
jgi:hypothetical protein